MTLGPEGAAAIPLEEHELVVRSGRSTSPISLIIQFAAFGSHSGKWTECMWVTCSNIICQAPTPDFNFSFITAKDETVFDKAVWTINNVSYISPETPTLVKILHEGADRREDFGINENTFVIPANKVIQVEFPATDEDELHRTSTQLPSSVL